MKVASVSIRNGLGKEVFLLKEKGQSINFGRDKKICHVAFDPHAYRVSRVHATIEWTEEKLIFIDKSKEGTIINGKRLKQLSEELSLGKYQLEIGGIPMSVEVDGDELEETICDTPPPEESNVSNTISIAPLVLMNAKESSPVVDCDNDCNRVSSMSTLSSLGISRIMRKRKPECSLLDISQPRGKRGPVAYTPINFDEEMESRGTKGPRARRADASEFILEETPAKKNKTTMEKPAFLTSQSAMKRRKSPSIEMNDEDVVYSTTNIEKYIPSASRKEERNKSDSLDHSELFSDRGPAAPNQTIKYCNLIFQPTNLKNNERTIDSRVPNFKKFVPKGMRDGLSSATSVCNKTVSVYNSSIQMIDSRTLR